MKRAESEPKIAGFRAFSVKLEDQFQSKYNKTVNIQTPRADILYILTGVIKMKTDGKMNISGVGSGIGASWKIPSASYKKTAKSSENAISKARRDALNDLIKRARLIQGEMYTKESWKGFASAFRKAVDIAASKSAGLASLSSVEAQLKTAIGKLKLHIIKGETGNSAHRYYEGKRPPEDFLPRTETAGRESPASAEASGDGASASSAEAGVEGQA